MTGDMGDDKMQAVVSNRFSTSMNESGHETQCLMNLNCMRISLTL